MEYKALSSEYKLIEDRTVTGLAAVFGNVDSGGDRILPGAFRKTLKEGARRIRHLWMHNPYEPPTAALKELREVGADELPDETQKAYPEATGGLLVVREYLDTPRGNEILAGIKAGAINEMSFGYDAIKADFDDEPGQKVRNLRELRLWDTSDVTWGMNAATVAAKLLYFGQVEKEITSDQLSELADLSRALLLPGALKTGRVLSSRNLERLKGALATLQEILLAAEPPVEDEDPKDLALTVAMRLQLAERELYLYQ